MAQGAQGLSFSLKKSSAKPPPAASLQVPSAEHQSGPAKEYITTVGRASSTQPDASSNQKVIQAQPDSYRIGCKATFVPSFVPEPESKIRSAGSKEDRFEAEKIVKTEPETIKYGLNLREPPGLPGGVIVKKEGHLSADVKSEVGAEAAWDSQEVREEQAYLEQVANLPDEAAPEVYEEMPVSEFGAALLRGMNWKKGDPVGRNKSNKAMEVVEYVPRDSRLGLGAKPSSITAGKKRKHVGKGDMVLPPSSDGRVRHTKTLDEKLVARESLGASVGKQMQISAGRHAGMGCRVEAILPVDPGRSERASVRLDSNDEIVVVRLSELSESSKHKSKKRKSLSKSKQDVPVDDLATNSSQRKRRSNDSNKMGSAPFETRSICDLAKQSWLHAGIRVRIIDKSMKGGKYYLKKGYIDDVLSPGIANIAMDDSTEVLEAVEQAQLETIVPKEKGAQVLVVGGDFKGQCAILLDRRLEKGVAAVQIKENMELTRVNLDEVAEYVGV